MNEGVAYGCQKKLVYKVVLMVVFTFKCIQHHLILYAMGDKNAISVFLLSI